MSVCAKYQIAPVGGEELAVIDLGPSISRELVEALDRCWLEYGKPFATGGPLGTACLPIAGAAAGASSSLFAGNVFLATANPATLMQLKGGVGSAVMAASGGGIVAQAPFVAASSALIPVVAPVLLFTTFSSMMMSLRFDRIEKTLIGMSELLQHLLKSNLVEDMARLMSSVDRLRDIREEYRSGPGFTDEMKMRLSLVERDVNVLRYKKRALATGRVNSVTAAQLSEMDKHMFVTASIADVEVDQLRLLLSLQDNPADTKRSWSSLDKKVARYEDDFRSLAEHSPAGDYRASLEESVNQMNWWNRNVLRRRALKTTEATMEGLDTIRRHSQQSTPWSEVSPGENDAGGDPARDYSIFFWRDDNGTGELKAWYTDDYRIDAATT